MNKRKYACLSLILLVGIAGCQQPAEQKASKETVTMMYTDELENFEKLVEDVYPEIDLQIERTTIGSINADSERRLRNGHGTDLIVTTLPTGNVKDYMMDLSATEVSTRYQATIMKPVMVEGRTQYLPLPGQYSGYILNKTFLEQLGKEVPASISELLDLIESGKENGIGIGEDGVSFGIEEVNEAAIGSYIIGTQVPDFLGLMEGIRWTSGFEEGTATFAGNWEKGLEKMKTYMDAGYLDIGNLLTEQKNLIPVKKRMLEGKLLISYGSVSLFSQLCEESGQYEYIMLPFLSDEGNASWVIFSPNGYIGINKELAREGEKGKLDACEKVLELLSSQKGQEAWIQDTRATNSFLIGYSNKEELVPEGIKECIKKGSVYTLRMPSNIVQYFGRTMLSVSEGEMAVSDALEMVDDYNGNGSKEVDYDQSIVGGVADDFLYEDYNTRLQETAIGNLVSDAVAEYTGADIAVVNGGSIRASLYKGDVRGADLSAVCPYEDKIILVEAKGSVIIKMLENSISMTEGKESVPGGRFLQVSGLHYSYKAPTQDSAAKLVSVTLPDGSALEADTYYKLAITDYMAGANSYIDNNGDGYTMLNLFDDMIPKAEGINILKETNAANVDAMKLYFYNHKDEIITAQLEGRIKIIDEGE